MALEAVRQRRRMVEASAQHDAMVYRAFEETLARFGHTLDGERVLDVGCGHNSPMTVILHSRGVAVTGIDAYIGYRWGLGFSLGRYRAYMREAGAARALRKLAGEVVYDRTYFSTLAATVGFPLGDERIDLRTMQVESLEFPDQTFDAVHSNATWEHLPDVAAANREVARVLRPGGVAYIEIHLFPSISGGHDLPWIVPGRLDLDGVTPWRHLLDSSWQPPVGLNRLRERDYRRLFEETSGLEVVDWQTEFTEAEHLVTPELLQRLPGYSADELTKRSIIAVLRKTRAH